MAETEEKPAAENPDDAIEVNEQGEEVTSPTQAETSAEPKVVSSSHWSRFKNWYASKKKLTIPLTILGLLVLLFLIPQTRYPLAGAIYKKDFRVQVLDSATNSPISGATVTSGSVSAQTGGSGQAVLHLGVGKHTFNISKTYYASQTGSYTVPILSEKTVPSISFVATGRQVKITVTNTFSHQPLANVDIKFTDTDTKTDDQGNAIGVVPATSTSEKVTLSLDGYNQTEATVQSSNSQIMQNNFNLTPSGKVYFLSKLSGKVDVVKTNLDGTDRQTVLAGTGFEDDTNTVLLASKDWKYLALLSQRDSSPAKLYLIDTSNSDKLTVIDAGNANFQPIGWDGYTFVYEVDRNNISPWKSNQSSIKSFNAATGQTIVLDNTTAVGTNQSNYASQSYDYYARNFYLVGNALIYSKSWNWGDSFTDQASKSNGIYSINVDGSNPQTLKTYPSDQYLDSFLYKPQTIYFHISANKDYYFTYESGAFSANQSIATVYQQYQKTYNNNTYLESPDGTQTFWYESLDGKNSLFLGDAQGNNSKTIGRDPDLTPYGWYTNNYLLVSKNSSELYILPTSGLSSTVSAYKVTDYHKPAYSYYGYGGGYGGL